MAAIVERERPDALLPTLGGQTALNLAKKLHDQGTLEGLRCLDVPAMSVQYHPEAAPGPHDSRYLFEEFRALMATT